METNPSQTISVEDAQTQINALPLPASTVGDIAWHENHRFVYTETGWVSQPEQA